MSQTLSLEIPDQLYETLKRLAEKGGRSAEDLGAAWLRLTIERVNSDPIMKLAGALQSGVPDLAERHDAYIAEHLLDELQDREG